MTFNMNILYTVVHFSTAEDRKSADLCCYAVQLDLDPTDLPSGNQATIYPRGTGSIQ